MRTKSAAIFKNILIVFATFCCIQSLWNRFNSINFKSLKESVNRTKKDWHNYTFMEYERNLIGIGEQGVEGKPYAFDLDEEDTEKTLFFDNGYNAYLSDLIPLNRSLPDIRHEQCIHELYFKDLPAVSVIIPLYNEHLSTLLRTIYSVVNRTPAELLLEIILVDDFSSKLFLKEILEKYVSNHFPIVKIVRLENRKGLIVARLEGAKRARADVLVFLDAHTEVNVNWLPPLLEPIVLDDTTCTCPLIDGIHYDTFAYFKQDDGGRGGFDWKFYYKRLPRLPEDRGLEFKPYKSPVMAGGLFAISSQFFWKLGGYDEGLDIWGGEQFELSFKIWQCGGSILDIPCSRVGHVFRGGVAYGNPRGIDYYHKNLKRVAEVWMDDYKEFIYKRHPEIYYSIDAGNLTVQKNIRKQLQCKSFQWYLEEVAPDLLQKFPPKEPPAFAKGHIRSIANKEMCVDTLGGGESSSLGLAKCSSDAQNSGDQDFELSYYRDIRVVGNDFCFDGAYPANDGSSQPILLYVCHMLQGNQMWEYKMDKQQLVQGFSGRCLDTANNTVFLRDCNSASLSQRWEWKFLNETLLHNWEQNGAPLLP